MITRTSNIGMQQNALSQLMNAQNKLLEIQNQAYSQKKVNTLSDNPTEIATIMNLNQQLSQIGSYYANITKAQQQFDHIDGVFSSVNNKLNRINDLGLQLLNGTGSAETVGATKAEIDQLIESVVDEANSSYNGQYIFSGAKVQIQPYEIQRDADGQITGIIYNGSEQGSEGSERKYEISSGVKISTNITGDAAFGYYDPDTGTGEGLFGSLVELSNIAATFEDNVAAGTVDDYFAQLETAMAGVESGMKHVAAVRSDFGSRSSRLTLTQSSLEDLELTATAQKSSLVDIDMVEALTNLVQQNYAYQSSMQVYMATQQISLLNYL